MKSKVLNRLIPSILLSVIHSPPVVGCCARAVGRYLGTQLPRGGVPQLVGFVPVPTMYYGKGPEHSPTRYLRTDSRRNL